HCRDQRPDPGLRDPCTGHVSFLAFATACARATNPSLEVPPGFVLRRHRRGSLFPPVRHDLPRLGYLETCVANRGETSSRRLLASHLRFNDLVRSESLTWDCPYFVLNARGTHQECDAQLPTGFFLWGVLLEVGAGTCHAGPLLRGHCS